MNKNLFIVGLCLAALSVFGLVMLYSTALDAADTQRFGLQIKVFGVGLILLALLVPHDYAWLQRPAVLYVFGGACALALIAVLIPGLGVQTNGSSRWIRGLGQPSEFAKPVVIVLVASWLARLDKNQVHDLKNGFLFPFLLGLVPAVLIFVEPDWGTAILLVGVTLLMLLVAGARWSLLAGTVAIAIVLLLVLAVFSPVRLERIMVFLDPEAHRRDFGWQIWQSLLAIGSGGLDGRWLDGSLHKFGYVPEQQTDFIFARIGEETGLWGSTIVVLLYSGIAWCGLQIARHARDRFGYFLAVGCTTLIALQASMNIAVATSMMPNKGLPLPFVSYGGSSLLGMFICAGLLGSVAWQSQTQYQRASNRLSVRAPVQLLLF
jgi:cell division protein FtsW